MANCDCGIVGLANMGRTGCVVSPAIPRNMLVAPRYDSTGAENFIDLSSGTFNQAFWEALLFNPDKSKRFQVMPVMEDFIIAEGEPLNQTFTSGKVFNVADGISSGTGMFAGKDSFAPLKAQFESIKCEEVVIWIIDYDKNISGVIDNGVFGSIYGMPMNSQSFTSQLMNATFSPSAQQQTINFNFEREFDPSTVYVLPASDMTYDIHRLRSMIDVLGTAQASPAPSTTGITLDLELNIFGTAVKRDAYQGATVIGDYTLTNVTDALAVTITGISPNVGGFNQRYTYAWAVQDSGDIMKLEYISDRYELITLTFVIP